MLGGRNFVEVDLLRGGQRMPMATPWPRCDYYVMISRADVPSPVDVWPIRVTDPLPTVPLPLDPGEEDIPINLGPLFTNVYDRSRYTVSVDYAAPLRPSLSAEDAEWAGSLLCGSGKR